MADYTINDSMAEMYLYETNSLLEELDQILLGAEKSNEFNSEEINSIFRIMHTIKGSSAMMEFDKIAKVAHVIEDLFAYIRTNGIDKEHNEPLFTLVFQANDFLREEVEKVEAGDALCEDISFLENKVTDFLNRLKGVAIETPADDVSSAADASTTVNKSTAPNGDNIIVVHFEDDCQMENIRAMVLVNKLREICSDVVHEPAELAGNANATQQILESGFKMTIPASYDLNQIIDFLHKESHIKGFTVNGGELVDKQHGGQMIRVFFEDDCQMENMRAFMLLQQIAEIYPPIASVPEELENNSEAAQQIINEGFLLSVEDESKVPEILEVIENALHIKSFAVEGGQSNGSVKTAEADTTKATPTESKPAPVVAAAEKEPTKAQEPKAEKSASTETKAAPAEGDGSHKAIKQSLISVNLNKLDTLMDLVGELVITESMVTSSPDLQGLELENFTKAARQLRKLTNDLQDVSMSIRMVSVSGAFQKMNRIVRDMNKKLGKDVDLILIGEETEVDKTIVDSIGDPLMHLVRNSMDHGIESLEERIQAGKDPRGKVTLSAENTGGEIIITVSDDGKGLDREKLLQKAQDKGFLTKAPSEYSDREAYMLLMMPGFSTKDQVTEFSGRGVGMDVVKQNIEKVGGTIHIESQKGKGMSTVFKIPLTLAIMDAMVVAVGTEIFTIPIKVISQSFKIRKEDLTEDINGNQMVMIRGECYSIVRLHQIYELDTDVTDIEEGILILVEVNNKAACIFVDSLLGQYQVVVKPLPAYLNNYDVHSYGITGCTILGDGNISLILDVANLLK